jgi:flavin reductase (DIM6/NTAB) family NADH-FMN oxidoreductase RutF
MRAPEHGSRETKDLVSLNLEQPVWNRFFTVAPLVIVGTKEGTSYDFAAKHLAMPIGWENRFGFVCTPQHHTYQNASREGYFTVSFPRPSRVVETSLTASPRCEDDSKPALDLLETFESTKIDGRYVADGYLYLGCELERIVDGFGDNSLIVGTIVEVLARSGAIRRSEVEDRTVIADEPLLVYVSPGHFARLRQAQAFPFTKGFGR